MPLYLIDDTLRIVAGYLDVKCQYKAYANTNYYVINTSENMN
jgi:hypothetical protein